MKSITRTVVAIAILVIAITGEPAPTQAQDDNALQISTFTACLGDGAGGLKWILTLVAPDLPEGTNASIRFSGQMTGALTEDLTEFFSPNGIGYSPLVERYDSFADVAAPGSSAAVVYLDAIAEIVFLDDDTDPIVFTAQGSAALPLCDQPVALESTSSTSTPAVDVVVAPRFTG